VAWYSLIGQAVKRIKEGFLRKGQNGKRGKYNLKARPNATRADAPEDRRGDRGLHRATGRAQTTITDIAKKAGVKRQTVYNHFPDELSLFKACSAHNRALNPPPTRSPGSLSLIRKSVSGVRSPRSMPTTGATNRC
jgi:hypothetical protein